MSLVSTSSDKRNLLCGSLFSLSTLVVTIILSSSNHQKRASNLETVNILKELHFPSHSPSSEPSPSASPTPPTTQYATSPSPFPSSISDLPAVSGCNAVLGQTPTSLTFTPVDEIRCLCERLQKRVDQARDTRQDDYYLPHRFSLETQRKDGFVFCLGLHTSGSIVQMFGHPSDRDQGRYGGGGRHGSQRSYFQNVLNQLAPSLPKNRVAVFWATTHDAAHISVGMLEELRQSKTPMLAWNVMYGQEKEVIMFPDFYFTDSGGYEGDKEKRNKAPLTERINKVIWRGVTTGLDDRVVGEHDWADLPRAKLCLKARDFPNILDAKVTGVVQVDWAAAAHYTQEGIVGNGMANSEMMRYRGQVDVDGNGSAWSGSFWKLLSGSVTIKVAGDFVQWYHYLVKPWEHYLPVKADMEDLREKVEWVVSNDNMEQKQTMATNAAEVLLGVTVASSMGQTAKQIAQYFFEPREHPLSTMYSTD
eukprot:c4041_g1_i1.p1 GENE.c4041_g1_i1~~c4041_g1_i1.p1  ORF type:complete len:476 (+),score=90.87 c4041_g1_i1:51-1478(+)